MASLGIDYGTGSWKTALLVEGRSPELRSFGVADYVRDSIAEVDRPVRVGVLEHLADEVDVLGGVVPEGGEIVVLQHPQGLE